MQNFIQLMGVLLIFVAVLFVTWLVLRWMGGLQRNQMGNRNLRVVDTIRVGNNKMISVVRAGTSYYLVAVGKDEVRLLGELEEESASIFAAAEKPSGQSQAPFGSVLERMKKKLPKKQDEYE